MRTETTTPMVQLSPAKLRRARGSGAEGPASRPAAGSPRPGGRGGAVRSLVADPLEERPLERTEAPGEATSGPPGAGKTRQRRVARGRDGPDLDQGREGAERLLAEPPDHPALDPHTLALVWLGVVPELPERDGDGRRPHVDFGQRGAVRGEVGQRQFGRVAGPSAARGRGPRAARARRPRSWPTLGRRGGWLGRRRDRSGGSWRRRPRSRRR